MTLAAAAIERLYRSHGHLVLRRARMLLGHEQDAQEALQEVFAALVRDPEALRRQGSAAAWLHQATTHHCLNFLRNRRTGARLLEAQVAPTICELVGASAEALAELRRLLGAMPADAAQALVCTRLDGMTHDEAAALLGCSRRQIGYLLERARQSLERAEQIA